MKENKSVPIWEKLTLTIEEAATYSNIGINKLRELVKEPRCTYTLRVGAKTLIKRKEFEEYIAKQTDL